jgi:hypothetical protein
MRSRFDRGEKNTLLPNFTPTAKRLITVATIASIKTASQIRARHGIRIGALRNATHFCKNFFSGGFTMKRLSQKLVPVALVFSMLWLAACEKNPTASKSPKPDLPPQSSLAVDLQAFNNNSAAGLSKTGADQTAVGLHFVAARVTVGVINLAVLAHMSVPVLTFAAALSQQPVLQDDAKWHWVYSVSNNAGQQFQADLAGWIGESAKVSRWEMRITTNGLARR